MKTSPPSKCKAGYSLACMILLVRTSLLALLLVFFPTSLLITFKTLVAYLPQETGGRMEFLNPLLAWLQIWIGSAYGYKKISLFIMNGDPE